MRIEKEIEKEIFETGFEIISETHSFAELKKIIQGMPPPEAGKWVIPIRGKSYLKTLGEFPDDTIVYVEEGNIFLDSMGNISGKGNLLRIFQENMGSTYEEVELIVKNECLQGIMIRKTDQITSPYVMEEKGQYSVGELRKWYPSEKLVVVKK